MCSGPIGNGQSYWGLIQIKIQGTQMSEDQLDQFKTSLTSFLNGNQAQAGLPQGAVASLANGTIKTDDQEDGTSIGLTNRNT